MEIKGQRGGKVGHGSHVKMWPRAQQPWYVGPACSVQLLWFNTFPSQARINQRCIKVYGVQYIHTHTPTHTYIQTYIQTHTKQIRTRWKTNGFKIRLLDSLAFLNWNNYVYHQSRKLRCMFRRPWIHRQMRCQSSPAAAAANFFVYSEAPMQGKTRPGRP